ncbi:class I SAM-dependent methyltransferase, partial [Candidatus Binatus sp.]|uniref:class I SAM-dependent methyltransferase n=1 Tax=Candidatus Binatus sp. TaxID=2811406 RepID=UPI003C7258D1
RTHRLILSTMFAFAGLAWISAPARAQMQPVATSTAESAPIPASQIPKDITDAINSPDRPAADKALDKGRRPDQIMAFYGIKPGMKVADIFAGGGYMTELYSRIVGPTGTVYSQNGPFPEQFKSIENAWDERLKEPALTNVVKVSKSFDAPDLLPVPPDSLDAVIIHLNYHDMVGFKLNRENVNAAVFKALKPGGIYGIVDHSAKPGAGATQTTTLHRIDEDFLIKDVEKAGFKLYGASSALRHPEDDRTWNVFKHRGETDRFMLKFVKAPAMAAGVSGSGAGQ